MARLLMGAIVTKAVGKIGGMCFRIKNQTQILQRNPNPFKNRAINQNSAMSTIRQVLGYWKNQSQPQQTAWGVIAVNNPQRDRFGNVVTLSARDYYNKSNINARLVGYGFVDEHTYDSTVPYLTFDSITLNATIQVIGLNNYDYDTNCRLAIYIRQVNSISVNPVANSLKLIAFINTNDYDGEYLWNVVYNTGYTFAIGSIYSIALRAITSSGVASPFIQYTVECDAN